MTATFSITRRISAALAAPAIVTGVLAGAVALGPPANAAPQGANCITAAVMAPSPNATDLLTRPGFFDAAAGIAQPAVRAISCISH